MRCTEFSERKHTKLIRDINFDKGDWERIGDRGGGGDLKYLYLH